MRVVALIAAAGKGLRMGSGTPKQYTLLREKPLLAHTLDVFERCALVEGIILVVDGAMMEYCRKEIVGRYGFQKVVEVVAGGKERQDSVYSGLKALPEWTEIVAVHDAARPLLPVELLEESIKEGEKWGAAAPALPITDTLKKVDGEGISTGTLERERLMAVQTPQVFRYQILIKAMESAMREGFRATDETAVVEWAGHRVKLLEGSPLNIKVTRPADLTLAESICRMNSDRGK